MKPLVREFVTKIATPVTVCNYWYISRQRQFNTLPRQWINTEQYRKRKNHVNDVFCAVSAGTL
jgi:hypothetical protein